MRIKIGDEWYSSLDGPICVEFTEAELDFVKTIDPEEYPERKFGVFPMTWTDPIARKVFMEAQSFKMQATVVLNKPIK